MVPTWMHAHTLTSPWLYMHPYEGEGEGEGRPGAAGWWDGLTAPAEQPAVFCRWISLLHKSAQENQFVLQRQGKPRGDKVCFTQSKWPGFPYRSSDTGWVSDEDMVQKIYMLSIFQLAHWVWGYLRSELDCSSTQYSSVSCSRANTDMDDWAPLNRKCMQSSVYRNRMCCPCQCVSVVMKSVFRRWPDALRNESNCD